MEHPKNEKNEQVNANSAIKVETELQVQAKNSRPIDAQNVVKTKVSRTTLPKDQIIYADKTVVFLEQVNGKVVRRKIDFNTPRTREAAASVGITYEECVKR